MEMDKKNLLKYQEIYNYAYILSDGIFKIVFAEEKDHTLLISLVNAMLDLHDGEAIKEITLENAGVPRRVHQEGLHRGYYRNDQRGRTRAGRGAAAG